MSRFPSKVPDPMRALTLVSGLLAAGSLLAMLAAAPVLAAPAETPAPSPTESPAQNPAEAPTSDASAPGCEAAETPSAQLLCRDAGLAAATAEMDAALKALGATTDDTGRAAIDAGQTVWRARRDEVCPVTASDLAESKTAKLRTDCLLRVTRQRTTALAAERQARSRPVADLPLAVTGAAAPRFAAQPPRVAPVNRTVTLSALAGRWAKADPNDRTAIDDCRSSYLEISAERSLHAVDARLPQFPLEGTLAADADPTREMAVLPAADQSAADAAGRPVATLRLLPADSARFDRLVLRMAPPATFAAEFLRCR